MAKMITRTIKVYTYTTGRVNFQTMKVEHVQNHSFPYKLGARDKRKLEATVGNSIMAETMGEALYGMSLDDFLRYAKPMSQEEAGLAEIE